MGEAELWTVTVQSGQEPSSSTENKMQGSNFCPFRHCPKHQGCLAHGSHSAPI